MVPEVGRFGAITGQIEGSVEQSTVQRKLNELLKNHTPRITSITRATSALELVTPRRGDRLRYPSAKRFWGVHRVKRGKK